LTVLKALTFMLATPERLFSLRISQT